MVFYLKKVFCPKKALHLRPVLKIDHSSSQDFASDDQNNYH